ncbi:MAG: carboxypeptidase regulatory-like domain-containing protein, partial [Thermoanaerobaculia bacterium]
MRRILAVTVLLWTAYASAQTTTAVLVGRVTSADTPLAGALVTITSPALQGARTAETSMHGTYTFPAVPPGTYRVTFAMSGLQTVVKSAELQLAETTRVDADLQAILTEEITVTPAPRAGLETQQISSNVAQEFVNILPIGRAITDIARIAPGVHDSGPGRRLTIHGAQSTDNLWLVNGVVITEARRNQPQNLFIEDAIQETTVLTAGVSAEYGRFLGGVINVLTKSGGNEPSGSIRDSISSDAWTARLPNDPEPLDKLNHDFEGTFGGRILRDRLWFFGAGRYAERRVRRQTTATLIPYVTGTDERRWEAKLTANLGASQTLIGSYLDVDAITLNAAATPPGDTRNLYDQLAPHSLLAAHYSAIFSTATVVEAHYTQKRYYLTAGASDTSLTGGTMIQDPYVNGVSLWAPPFCNVCGDNYRNNRDAMVKATLFLSRPRWGSHSIVAGVNDFHELSRDESKQSGSDFIVTTPTVLGDDGVLYPQMIPGESSIEWY